MCFMGGVAPGFKLVLHWAPYDCIERLTIALATYDRIRRLMIASGVLPSHRAFYDCIKHFTIASCVL